MLEGGMWKPCYDENPRLSMKERERKKDGLWCTVQKLCYSGKCSGAVLENIKPG